MKPTTINTARKAIRYFHAELGSARITGGSLPDNNGLVVGVRPPQADTEAVEDANELTNGNGSHPAPAEEQNRPLQAMLVIGDEGEHEMPLIEVISDGFAVGPTRDKVGPQTRAAVLSWSASDRDTDGTLTESYVISEAAHLIDRAPSTEIPPPTGSDPQVAQQPSSTVEGDSQGTHDTYTGTARQQERGQTGADASSRTTAEDSGQTRLGDNSAATSPESDEDLQHETQPTEDRGDHTPGPVPDTQLQPLAHEEASYDESIHDEPTSAPVSGQPITRVTTAHAADEPATEDPEAHQGKPTSEVQLVEGTEPRTAAGQQEAVPGMPGEEELARLTEEIEDSRGEEEGGPQPAPSSEPGSHEAGHGRNIAQSTASEESVGASEGGGPQQAEQASTYDDPLRRTPPISATQDTHLPEAKDDEADDSDQQATGSANQTIEPTEHDGAQHRTDEELRAEDDAVGETPSPGYDDRRSTYQQLDEKAQREHGRSPQAEQPRPQREQESSGAANQHPAPITGSDCSEDYDTGWLHNAEYGKTQTPEQRAYLMAKQRVNSLGGKLLLKKAPEPPPRLATIEPIPAKAIERIANAPEGPGIVEMMTVKGGTGKTTNAIETSYTLAKMFGDQGNDAPTRTGRILLIDQNVTNPDLIHRVGVDGEAKSGIKDLIAGEHLSHVVSRTALPNLDVLFLLGRGDRDIKPLREALHDQHTMEALISAVVSQGDYQVIVVDTANTLPGNDEDAASFVTTVWASVADARYLILQPEEAAMKDAAWFASDLGQALGPKHPVVPVLNSFPMQKVYQEAPITSEMAAKRKSALAAVDYLQNHDAYPIVSAIGAQADKLDLPLIIPDYPEEARGFAAEKRPLSLYSQTIANAYRRIGIDAVRRMLDNRNASEGA